MKLLRNSGEIDVSLADLYSLAIHSLCIHDVEVSDVWTHGVDEFFHGEPEMIAGEFAVGDIEADAAIVFFAECRGILGSHKKIQVELPAEVPRERGESLRQNFHSFTIE